MLQPLKTNLISKFLCLFKQPVSNLEWFPSLLSLPALHGGRGEGGCGEEVSDYTQEAPQGRLCPRTKHLDLGKPPVQSKYTALKTGALLSHRPAAAQGDPYLPG